jgi:hypothetical protein
LYSQDQGRYATQLVGQQVSRAQDRSQDFEKRAFSNEEKLIRRNFGRLNGEVRRERTADTMRNLARRERQLKRSLERKQKEIEHQVMIRKSLHYAKVARRKLRGQQRVNTDRVIKFMRNQSRRQRKQVRATERRREIRDRHRDQEELSRRSEARLQREISERHRSKALKGLMEGLLERQSNFLDGISRNMKFWANRQHKVHKKHTEAFKRLDRNLNARLRRLQQELEDE